MNNEKLNNDLDNVFREELENLPEERPSADDWQRMSKRIQAEGLMGNNSNGRKYLLLLLLLFVLISAVVSLPFLFNSVNNTETLKKKEMNLEKINAPKQNGINETTTSSPGTAGNTAINSASNASNEQFNDQQSEQLSKRLSAQNTLQSFAVEKENTNYENSSEAKESMTDKNSETGTQESTAPVAEDASGNDMQTNDSHAKNDMANENAVNEGVNAASTQPGIQGEKNISSVTVTSTTTTTSTNAANTGAEQGSAANIPNDSTTTTLSEDEIKGSDALRLSRFRLGIYVSLDYNYYTLKKNSSVAEEETDLVSQSDFIEGEESGAQYSVGVIGGYIFTQKLSLEAGVLYSQKKKLHADIYTSSYPSSSGEQMFSDFSYDYQARYVELFGRIKYYLHRKKNSIYVTLGAASVYNLPVSDDSSDYFSRTSYGETSAETDRVSLDASSAGLIMIISAGIEIPVGKRWEVYIEPAYRYSFDPVIKHPTYDRMPIEHFLRSISLATGLMYKF